MSTAKVYVVCADAGEYSDTRWWTVRAFLTQREAEHEAERLNAWVKRWVDGGGRRKDTASDQPWSEHPPGDPDCAGMLPSDPPPTYAVEALPLGVYLDAKV